MYNFAFRWISPFFAVRILGVDGKQLYADRMVGGRQLTNTQLFHRR